MNGSYGTGPIWSRSPVDSTYFFDRLYPFQDAVIREMAALDTGFYLTGGTAASRG